MQKLYFLRSPACGSALCLGSSVRAGEEEGAQKQLCCCHCTSLSAPGLLVTPRHAPRFPTSAIALSALTSEKPFFNLKEPTYLSFKV